MLRFALASLAALTLAACTTGTSNPNALPGDHFATFNPISYLDPVSPNGQNWQRVRLIAPAGASECGISSFHSASSPQHEGEPNANNEVELAIKLNSESVRLYCRTEDGRVTREVAAPIVFQFEARGEFYETSGEDRSFPPIIHIAGRDARSEERWRVWQEQACAPNAVMQNAIVCEPDTIALLRAVDLGS